MKHAAEFEKFERHCDTVNDMIKLVRESDLAREDEDYRTRSSNPCKRCWNSSATWRRMVKREVTDYARSSTVYPLVNTISRTSSTGPATYGAEFACLLIIFELTQKEQQRKSHGRVAQKEPTGLGISVCSRGTR